MSSVIFLYFKYIVLETVRSCWGIM